MICAEVENCTVVLSAKRGLTNSALSKFEYLSGCILVVLSLWKQGCFFLLFYFWKALNFYSVKLGHKCKRKIQMLTWTLSSLSLQRKHEQEILNESSFVRAPQVQFFGLCSRSAFGSWGDWSMARSSSPYPSGHWLLCNSDNSALAFPAGWLQTRSSHTPQLHTVCHLF